VPGEVSGLPAEEASRPVSPDFKQEQTRPGEGALTLAGCLQALHEATGQTVLADYFTRPQRLPRPNGPVALQDFLRSVAGGFGRDCRADAAGFYLRSTTWPEDERAEVPAARLRPWLERRAERGFLPPDDWLEMGRLSPLQLLGLCDSSDLFGEALAVEALAALRGVEAFRSRRVSPPGSPWPWQPRGYRGGSR
jgi:hypothetical protein